MLLTLDWIEEKREYDHLYNWEEIDSNEPLGSHKKHSIKVDLIVRSLNDLFKVENLVRRRW